MSQITACDERGIDFPALTVVGNEFDFIEDKLRQELMERTLGLGALPVLFPISASQTLNSQMAVSFRSSLQKKMWTFLIPDGDAEEFLIRTNKEYIKNPNDSNSYAFFLSPYIQTGLFIGECINLDMGLANGLIRLTEKSGCYKDRYSSVSYANWIISQFDKNLLKENEEKDWFSDFMELTQIF